MALPITEEGLAKTLEAIYAKEAHELTPLEIGILKSRWDYVDRGNRRKFESVLKTGITAPVEGKPEEVVKDPNAFPGDKPSDDDGVDE